MATREMTVAQALSILEETPRRLRASAEHLGPSRCLVEPSPGEWSLNGILAHLRSCADVWGDAVATILGQEHRTIRAVNPTSWIESTDYRDLDFPTSLQAYTAGRRRLLGMLRPLERAAWSRRATVVGAGAPTVRTVKDYVDRLARHERTHWREMEKTVALVVAVGS